MQPWSPGTPIRDLPGRLPPDNIPSNIELSPFPDLSHGILSNSSALTPAVLAPWALWLDMLAKTGAVRTRSRTEDIVSVWRGSRRVQDVRVDPLARVVRLAGASWVMVDWTFRVKIEGGKLVGVGSGVVGFTLDEIGAQGEKIGGKGAGEGGKWRVWLLTTVLECFEDCGNPDMPIVKENGWTLEISKETTGSKGSQKKILEQHYTVVIIGGGQNGLSLAARLQALSIDYVVLERSHLPGYTWQNRYDSVRQHTIRQVNNLPFGNTWDADEEEFLPGSKVAAGFRAYVEKFGLNLRTSAEVTKISRQDEAWKVTVDGRQQIRASHVAFAVGAGLASPRRPIWPGEEKFKGKLMHMVDFKNSKAWTGKRGIVIGSGTAGHDIAQDMLVNGLNVTMVQRGQTAVYPISWYANTQRGMYRDDIPDQRPDRIAFALPTKISGDIQWRSYQTYAGQHPAYFEQLRKAGFKVDMGDTRDQTPNEIVLNHFGGYYIDIGTSKHIMNGDIKVVNGTVDQFHESGILVNGRSIQADLVVAATGYEPDYRKDLARLLGPAAEELPIFWGLTEEGDIRGLMEESAPGLWLMGGAAAHARFFSRFIALQIQQQLLSKSARI